MPGNRRTGSAHSPLRALERDGHGRAREQGSPRNSAATSRASRRRRRSTTSASITSSARRATRSAAISSSSRDIRRPGFYARAFLEGRITEEQLENFRQEVDGKGLSSYPHPWLMPDFWQFPTVSMGLGPDHVDLSSALHALSARSRYRRHGGRKVWAFLGDGEIDEPESLGAISLAGREKLDNLIWVINCNLQRLDGPVRGNGKIIQELEARLQGRRLERHQGHLGKPLGPAARSAITSGRLVQLMNECVDGDYQTFKSRDGKYVRENFFGRYPETAALVEDWSDDEIWALAARRPRSASKSTRRIKPPSSTRDSRPSFSPRRSKATAWARPAKRRTSRIKPRR